MDGLIYWNEDMPEITDLDPLFLGDNQYIGWVQDPDVYDMIDTNPERLAYYYSSLSSMPCVVVDNDDNVFAIWTGVTTYLDVNYPMAGDPWMVV
jgi:hypothetical protein